MERVIWTIITSEIIKYSKLKIESEDIKPTDKIKTYFPVKNIKDMNDEEALLFTQVLIETLDTINYFDKNNLKLDFLPRQEWELFETVGDLFMYFNYLRKEKG